MLKIAITGNVASGKSVFENMLKERGYSVFDTDEIAHDILSSSDEVKKTFKDFDILTDGIIDRKKLAGIVFYEPDKMKMLENIIHPKVKEEILKIFSMDKDIVFISVPQLFEAGFEGMFDKIIFITANEDIRLERLMKRNKITKEEALRRIKSQLPDYSKTEHCDLVIENNGTKKDLERFLDKIDFLSI